MQKHDYGTTAFFSYSRFDDVRNVTNIITTRVGGASEGNFHAMNLSFNVGDDPDIVLQNRATVSQALGIEPEMLTFPEQVHGSKVVVVDKVDRGRGAITDDDGVPGADALVTRTPGLPLVVTLADCVATSLYDTRNNAIGLAHAGWKGTLGRIVAKTLSCMQSEFGTKPTDVFAGISPSIGPGHFEVGQEVADAFKKEFEAEANEFVVEDMHGTCYVNLWLANEAQLIGGGVLRENIQIAEIDTAARTELFYSHRRENGKTGRFAAIMMIHGPSGRIY